MSKAYQICQNLLNELNYPIAVIILSIIQILVSSLRFNGNSMIPFISNLFGQEAAVDSVHYIALVDFFRGLSTQVPNVPFTYRPLLPYLASYLPFNADTCLNLINLICLLFTSLCIMKILEIKKLNLPYQFVGALLFIVSFPTFYYGTIGYVDSGGLLAISICYIMTLKKQWFGFFICFGIGLFARESILICLPLLTMTLLISRKWWQAIIFSMIGLSIFLAASKTARLISVNPGYFTWYYKPDMAWENITRVKTWLSLVLSLGLPALCLVIYGLKKIKSDLNEKNLNIWQEWSKALPELSVIGTCFALFLFSILTAHADGRFIWPASIFSIVLALSFHKHLKQTQSIL